MTSWNDITPELPTLVDPDGYLLVVGDGANGRPAEIFRVERFAQAPETGEQRPAWDISVKLVPVFDGGQTPDCRPYRAYALVLKKEAPQWLLDRYEAQEAARAARHTLARTW